MGKHRFLGFLAAVQPGKHRFLAWPSAPWWSSSDGFAEVDADRTERHGLVRGGRDGAAALLWRRALCVPTSAAIQQMNMQMGIAAEGPLPHTARACEAHSARMRNVLKPLFLTWGLGREAPFLKAGRAKW